MGMQLGLYTTPQRKIPLLNRKADPYHARDTPQHTTTPRWLGTTPRVLGMAPTVLGVNPHMVGTFHLPTGSSIRGRGVSQGRGA